MVVGPKEAKHAINALLLLLETEDQGFLDACVMLRFMCKLSKKHRILLRASKTITVINFGRPEDVTLIELWKRVKGGTPPALPYWKF